MAPKRFANDVYDDVENSTSALVDLNHHNDYTYNYTDFEIDNLKRYRKLALFTGELQKDPKKSGAN